MNPVISVRGLGKKYRIGIKRHDTLRDQIASTFKSLFRRNNSDKGQGTKDKGLPNQGLWTTDQGQGAVDQGPRTKDKGHSEEFWALRDVSFDVQQGEVVGIIGRNGAGKSTLLKILSQITEPTTGEIAIKGRVASLLEVGTGFHPELTGRENIFLNGAILGMSRAEIKRKFDEIVAFSEIEKFIDTPVKHYSSGMYVRLAFAVAAHLEPEILIVDEVLAVGDGQFQKKCLGKMDEVSKSGRTVLFVSHNMAAIESLCSKSILLNTGKLVAYGPALDIIASYLSSMDGEQSDKRKRMGEFSRSADVSGLIRRAVLLNSRQEITGQIRVGDLCEFQVELESTKVFLDVAVGLHVQNEARQRVTSFHTRYQKCPAMDLNKRLILRCKCPELMLVPGNYILELAVASSGRVEDRVEHGFSFCVVDADVLGAGKVPPSKDGVLVSRGYWEVSQP